jgi:hypothetical protein
LREQSIRATAATALPPLPSWGRDVVPT